MSSLSPKRWALIQELFSHALDLEEPERSSYLDEECAGDSELRKEVESLLHSHGDESLALMAELDVHPLSEVMPRLADDLIGSVLGPYKIIKALGKGGMGQVYLASRNDNVFKRQVALKIIKRGMDSDEILRRFQVEQQIVASLSHTNIAKLFDGGVTDDGRPYFAMEYIDGQPITDYFDQNKLSIKERVGIIIEVCSAVHYAHQNLIVHRDIKPSNIWVTANGTPKLLDFGIAKILNPGLSSSDVPVTRTQYRMMTPEYASPEQVMGKPMTTASDVYSLGVLLYRLLTGEAPYDLETKSQRVIEKVICEQDPERPSTKATLSETKKELSGDLDKIILTAMRKEPIRRYASVAQLSEDLRRYLEGMPISARKDALGYRVQKFVGRHKLAVTASALILCLLAGWTVTSSWQSSQIAQQNENLKIERDRGEQFTEMLLDMFRINGPLSISKSRTDTMDVGMFLTTSGDNIIEALADQANVQIKMLNVLGRLALNMERYDQSREYYEQAALSQREQSETDSLELATTLQWLGIVLDTQHRYQEALPPLVESYEIRQRHLDSKSTDMLRSKRLVATLYRKHGDMKSAAPILETVLQDAVNEYGQDHLITGEAKVQLAHGLLTKVAGRLSSYHQPNEIAPDLLRAEKLYSDALAIRIDDLGPDHIRVSDVQRMLGHALKEQGRFAESESQFRMIHDSLIDRLSPGHSRIAATKGSLAEVLVYQGKAKEAELLLLETISSEEQRLGSRDNPRVAWWDAILGACYTLQGRYSEASKLLHSSQDIILSAHGPRYEYAKRIDGFIKDLEALAN